MPDGQLSLFEDNNPPPWVPDGRRLVYFIKCGAFIKIGFTQRTVEARCNELKTGNPHRLQIIGTVAVPEGEDDHTVHRLCAQFHARDEWFHDTPELRQLMKQLVNKQRTTKPFALARPDVLGQPLLWWITCPECKGHQMLGLIVDAVGDRDLFGHTRCVHCGIKIPLVWGDI